MHIQKLSRATKYMVVTAALLLALVVLMSCVTVFAEESTDSPIYDMSAYINLVWTPSGSDESQQNYVSGSVNVYSGEGVFLPFPVFYNTATTTDSESGYAFLVSDKPFTYKTQTMSNNNGTVSEGALSALTDAYYADDLGVYYAGCYLHSSSVNKKLDHTFLHGGYGKLIEEPALDSQYNGKQLQIVHFLYDMGYIDFDDLDIQVDEMYLQDFSCEKGEDGMIRATWDGVHVPDDFGYSQSVIMCKVQALYHVIPASGETVGDFPKVSDVSLSASLNQYNRMFDDYFVDNPYKDRSQLTLVFTPYVGNYTGSSWKVTFNPDGSMSVLKPDGTDEHGAIQDNDCYLSNVKLTKFPTFVHRIDFNVLPRYTGTTSDGFYWKDIPIEDTTIVVSFNGLDERKLDYVALAFYEETDLRFSADHLYIDMSKWLDYGDELKVDGLYPTMEVTLTPAYAKDGRLYMGRTTTVNIDTGAVNQSYWDEDGFYYDEDQTPDKTPYDDLADDLLDKTKDVTDALINEDGTFNGFSLKEVATSLYSTMRGFPVVVSGFSSFNGFLKSALSFIPSVIWNYIEATFMIAFVMLVFRLIFH